jgi:hypothetical protein
MTFIGSILIHKGRITENWTEQWTK